MTARDRRFGFSGLRCLLAGLVIDPYVLTRYLNGLPPSFRLREIAPPTIYGNSIQYERLMRSGQAPPYELGRLTQDIGVNSRDDDLGDQTSRQLKPNIVPIALKGSPYSPLSRY